MIKKVRTRKPSAKARAVRAAPASQAPLALCLYVAGNAPNSQLAVSNLAAICAEYLPGRFQLEIVDVLATPLRALADGILVTPSLALPASSPAVRIIGNLSDRDGVLHALGIT